MENKQAKKLIDTILKDIENNGIVVTSLVEKLQTLRPYAVEEQIPLLAKVIRLTSEHLENNEGFFIPIPDDEPIEEENEEGETIVQAAVPAVEFNAVESLSYLVLLMKDVKNKINITDLRAYCNALQAY